MINEGDRVNVVDYLGRNIAIGHYQQSSISVRILTFEDENLDENFWINKIDKAYTLRRQVGLANSETTNCYRLVNGEGDGLSGLIIDIYGAAAVIQCHSTGMYREVDHLVNALQKVYGERLSTIYMKNRLSSEHGGTDGFLLGDKPGGVVLENGLTFHVNWVEGQKTGFFLDQRDNRNLLRMYAQGKRILNAYCYTGGFSVYALASEARAVDSVDISGKAIELTIKNIEGNFPQTSIPHHEETADVMKYLRDTESDYDLMILDPPAFAKSQRKRHNAVQAYKRLNALAFEKIDKGGIVFTFSCSQVVDRPLFVDTIRAAAIEAGRRIQILHHLSQPADHPIDVFHPEGSYLKGLVLKVT